jgi:HAD superfamily hydrolase (TIGR01509 family)
MRKSNGVIFDMDGVLVDTEPIYFDITRTYLSKLGVRIPKSDLYRTVGISMPATFANLKTEYSLTTTVDEMIAEEFRIRSKRLRSMRSMPVIPGIIEFLAELAELDVPCAVASSSAVETISLILSKSGLDVFFSITVSGDEVANGKPAPDIFLEAAGRLDVPPERCLVIEDSPHGIEGARAAGMETVGFANPNSGNQDLSGADLVVPGFEPASRREILAMLNRA